MSVVNSAWLRVVRPGVALSVVTLAVAGCGSDDAAETAKTGASEAAQTSTGPAADGANGLAVFDAIVPPPEVPALSGEPPKGVKVAAVQCNVPVCAETFAPMKAAVKRLGWELQILSYDISKGPVALNTALQQATEAKPDYITWTNAFPYATQEKSIKAATAAGIGLIPAGGSMEDTFLNCVQCEPQFEAAGVTAMKVAQALEKDPQVGLVLQPDINAQKFELTGMEKQAEEAGGKASPIPVSVGNPSTVNNQSVVSYLRTHPDVKYVVTTTDAFGEGLPAALKRAGLDTKVKYIANVITSGGDVINLVKSGRAEAGIATELAMSSYRVLDTAIRDSMKQELPEELIDPVGWQQVVTNANVGEFPATYQAKDWEEAYFAAWGV